MPERLRGGQKHREYDQDDRCSFEEATQDQQHDVDGQQEHQRREIVGLQHPAQRLRNVLRRDDVVEDERGRDQHADRHGDARAGDERVVDILPADAAVEQRGYQQRVGGSDRGGLRRRGDAAVQATEEDHRHQQRRHRLPCDARQLPQRHARLDREVAAFRHRRDEAALDSTEQQAGTMPPTKRNQTDVSDISA